jgi:hypothetical protein
MYFTLALGPCQPCVRAERDVPVLCAQSAVAMFRADVPRSSGGLVYVGRHAGWMPRQCSNRHAAEKTSMASRIRFSLAGLRRRLATWRASKRRLHGAEPIRKIRCTRPQKNGDLPQFVLTGRASTAENPEHASAILLLWWVGCENKYVQTPREVRWTSEVCISSRHREAKRFFSLGTYLCVFTSLHIFGCELRYSLIKFIRSHLCSSIRLVRIHVEGVETAPIWRRIQLHSEFV